jgi:hypothetical protein
MYILIPMWIASIAMILIPEVDTGLRDGSGLVLAILLTLVTVCAVGRRSRNANRSRRASRRRYSC